MGHDESDIHVHVHITESPQMVRQMGYIQRGIDALLTQGDLVMDDLTALDAAVASAEAEIAQNTDVTASAAALLQQLGDLMRQNASDPAAIQALADRITAAAGSSDVNNATLAAAVAANTPAA